MVYEEMAGNVFGEDVTAGNPNKVATVRCRGICDFLRIDNHDIEEVCLAREMLLILSHLILRQMIQIPVNRVAMY